MNTNQNGKFYVVDLLMTNLSFCDIKFKNCDNLFFLRPELLNKLSTFHSDSCSKNPPPCHNGGTCEINMTGPKCQCTDRYQGDRCDTCADGYYGDICSKF